jgi:hypothetical protein
MVSGSCVALKGTAADAWVATAWGASTIDAQNDRWSSWWCSNGLYKNVTASGAVTNNSIQTLGYGMNKRMEFAMVGCPQKSTLCGQTSSIVTALVADSVDAPFTVGAILQTDKCSYVATSTVVPPAFVMSEGIAVTAKGLMTSNWQIHAMEYTATAAGVAWAASEGSL